MDEFSLIRKYFNRASERANGVWLGIGDDAALVEVPAGHYLVQTMDTLVSGRHFPVNTSAWDIAWKSLAVNVSDLVAMASVPKWFLLSLTLPEPDEVFLHGFSEGLFAAAGEFGITLIGGDTCKGALSVTIQASGLVDTGAEVTRCGAMPGDRIFLSGPVGSAAMGLAALQGRESLPEPTRIQCIEALNRPRPCLGLIPLLRDHASAAIDVSDGLLADLRHILDCSGVGALVDRDAIPVQDWISEHDAYAYALSGGDDYQILFTVPASKAKTLREQASVSDVALFEIGEIMPDGFEMIMRCGAGLQRESVGKAGGFNHFGS